MPRGIHIESDDVLGAASTIAELTESITDLLRVPIASTAASLISTILKSIKVCIRGVCIRFLPNKACLQEVKDNDDARIRLAKTVAIYLKRLQALNRHGDLRTLEVQLDELCR